MTGGPKLITGDPHMPEFSQAPEPAKNIGIPANAQADPQIDRAECTRCDGDGYTRSGEDCFPCGGSGQRGGGSTT